MAEKITRSIVMTREMNDTIKRLSAQEKREFSAQVNVLLEQALSELRVVIKASEPEAPPK